MPNYTCPSCRQTFHAEDDPAGPCLFCGHLLTEYVPPPRFHPGSLDLRQIARLQRWILRALPIALASEAALLLAPAFNLLGVRGELFLAVAPLLMLGLVAALLVRLDVSDGTILLYAFLMLVPVLNLVLWFEANARATAALKRAGLRVGLLGARDEDVLSIIDPYRCNGCGYNLFGNVSGRCPECGRDIPRS